MASFVSVSALFCAVMLLMLAYERARSDALETLAALGRSLDEARQQAERASRAKTAFLANVSHELRTPMTAILGFTDMLLGDWSERSGLDEPRQLIASVRASGRQLLGMIHDLLDFSKAESGRLSVESLAFAPEAVLRAALDGVRAGAQAKGLELALVLPEPLPASVRGDPGRLGQAVAKLLDNAVKFTDRGRVELRARVADGRLEIAVSDTGVGIPREEFAAIFTSFHQLDASATRERGGTGLGLALCERLVQAQGGTILLRSSPGEKTEVAVRLPRCPSKEVRRT